VLRKQLKIAFFFDNKIHLLKVTTTLGFESTLEATEKSKDFGTEFDLQKPLKFLKFS